MRHSSKFIGAALAGITILALIVQRAENQQLRGEIRSLQERYARYSALVTDTSGAVSPMTGRNTVQEPSGEPSHELLRLRGEVGRLRLELQEAQKRGPQPLAAGSLSGFSFLGDDWYAMLGVDTNTIPRRYGLRTTNEVLEELQRVGAEILADEEQTDATHYIHAVLRPAKTVPAGAKVASVGLQFWFKDGLLDVRTDSPEWH